MEELRATSTSRRHNEEDKQGSKATTNTKEKDTLRRSSPLEERRRRRREQRSRSRSSSREKFIRNREKTKSWLHSRPERMTNQGFPQSQRRFNNNFGRSNYNQHQFQHRHHNNFNNSRPNFHGRDFRGRDQQQQQYRQRQRDSEPRRSRKRDSQSYEERERERNNSLKEDSTGSSRKQERGDNVNQIERSSNASIINSSITTKYSSNSSLKVIKNDLLVSEEIKIPVNLGASNSLKLREHQQNEKQQQPLMDSSIEETNFAVGSKRNSMEYSDINSLSSPSNSNSKSSSGEGKKKKKHRGRNSSKSQKKQKKDKKSKRRKSKSSDEKSSSRKKKAIPGRKEAEHLLNLLQIPGLNNILAPLFPPSPDNNSSIDDTDSLLQQKQVNLNSQALEQNITNRSYHKSSYSNPGQNDFQDDVTRDSQEIQNDRKTRRRSPEDSHSSRKRRR